MHKLSTDSPYYNEKLNLLAKIFIEHESFKNFYLKFSSW